MFDLRKLIAPPANDIVGLPWRGGDGEAPLDVSSLPLFRGLRPLKRWRYLGVYGADVQLCVGVARIAGAAQSFWAVHDRISGEFRDRAVMWSAVEFGDRSVSFTGVDLRYERAGDPVEVVTLHGDHPIWTRKTPVRVTGTVDGKDIDSRGLVDESAGHHARVTKWFWSAGCGVSTTGAEVTWNLVDGVHDSPTNSERTLWVDGVPREVDAVDFAADLSRAGELAFHAEAQRARHDRLVLIDSEYRQPFGTFTGRVGNVELSDGYGVMESHDVRW
ncbi:MAG: DUF2804 domain-containing protein [Nocardiaceae bacterium]|nr:DUF2804 domain-containing protein [Nocardiaceae bacterium]